MSLPSVLHTPAAEENAVEVELSKLKLPSKANEEVNTNPTSAKLVLRSHTSTLRPKLMLLINTYQVRVSR